MYQEPGSIVQIIPGNGHIQVTHHEDGSTWTENVVAIGVVVSPRRSPAETHVEPLVCDMREIIPVSRYIAELGANGARLSWRWIQSTD